MTGVQGAAGVRGEAAGTATTVAECLAHSGLRAVLSRLNARTRYRFTGLYRIDVPFLRNEALYDRENPSLNVGGDVCLLRETYCGIVWETQAPYSVADALGDEQLAAHAARLSVQSYLGVPVLRGDGSPWGTLCHFDVRPRLAPPGEAEVLRAAAAAISPWVDTVAVHVRAPGPQS